MAFGQEVTVTPLQLLTAYAAMANGGWLMRPRVVEHIVQDEEFQFFAPHARHRVLSPQTLERMNEILVGVVERGTGKQAAVEGYTVAGKTGTPRKSNTAPTATVRFWLPLWDMCRLRPHNLP